MDLSPYYGKGAGNSNGLADGPYIDEMDAVDLGPDEGDFNRKSNYPYGPQNSGNQFAGSTN